MECGPRRKRAGLLCRWQFGRGLSSKLSIYDLSGDGLSIKADTEDQFIGGVHLGYNLQGAHILYGIEGDADFRPTQVFDDGTHTYIRLPERLQELPALFMLTPDTGETALVNYAVSEPYLIVQRTMERFLLQLGKAKVTVRRGVKRGFWSFLESSSRAAGAGEGGAR